MDDVVFPILGSADVPLVGRDRLLKNIWSNLTKPTASNLSVVGPKHMGKTVFLKAVAERARLNDSPYDIVMYWEVGSAPPESDERFIEELSKRLQESMSAETFRIYRDELSQDRSFGVLREVMDLLASDGHRVLMVWDGFDKPLSQGLLTGHLFGQLRSLFYGKPHKVITATRVPQTELTRNQQVEDSPFWTLFDVTPVRIGPFDESDVQFALNRAGLTALPGGMKELANWSAGHPVILLSLLNRLVSNRATEFDHTATNLAASATAEDLSSFFDGVWNGLSSNIKEAFWVLVNSGDVAPEMIGRAEVQHLVNLGFAVRDSTKLKASCRMMANHVRQLKPDAGNLVRQFGAWDKYRLAIVDVLELRLAQVSPPVCSRLHKWVRLSLQDLPDEPDRALAMLSQIEDRALDLIWEYEFGSNAIFPTELMSYWTGQLRSTDNIVKEFPPTGEWRIPGDRYKQVAILQRLTGSTAGLESRSRAVSKEVYVLINTIHSFRNLNQHSGGQTMHEGVAVTAIIACVELLACLSRVFRPN